MLKEAAEPPGAGYDSNPAAPRTSLRCIKTQLEALKIQLEESARYHQRRGGFYGRLHNVTVLAGVVLGWTAFGAGSVFGFLTAVAGALGLVLYFSGRAEVHEKLLQRYDKLASETRMEEPTAEHLRRCAQRERQIAATEPPTYWALKAACYNDVLRAHGRKKRLHNIRLLPRLLMNVVKFDENRYFRRTIGD